MTPAEKSASQVHVLLTQRKTYCGITFRRDKFRAKNTTLSSEASTCDKCKKAVAEEK
jgi:hypothetical protein